MSFPAVGRGLLSGGVGFGLFALVSADDATDVKNANVVFRVRYNQGREVVHNTQPHNNGITAN